MRKLDLDVGEIVRLREEEGMTYEEIRDELGYDCHPDTVGSRYRNYKKKQQESPLQIKAYATKKVARPWWKRLWDWLWR